MFTILTNYSTRIGGGILEYKTSDHPYDSSLSNKLCPKQATGDTIKPLDENI
jgi:hypothetical protein